MLKYVLTLLACLVLEVLAAMGVVQYVDVFYSTDTAMLVMLYAVIPATAAIVVLTIVALDAWRVRLVSDACIERNRSHGRVR